MMSVDMGEALPGQMPVFEMLVGGSSKYFAILSLLACLRRLVYL